MKKSYKVKGMDCAACAAKMERRCAKAEGVKRLSLNFMSERLTIEAEDAAFQEAEAAVLALLRRFEPEWQVTA